MFARTVLSGSVVALALTCTAPAMAAQNPGPARVKGNFKVAGTSDGPLKPGVVSTSASAPR